MDPLPRPAGRTGRRRPTPSRPAWPPSCSGRMPSNVVSPVGTNSRLFSTPSAITLRIRLRKEGVPIDKARVRTSMIVETVVASRGRAKLETWFEEFYDSCQLDQSALEAILARLPWT